METLPNVDGIFTLTNVPPGNYRVRVISGLVERQAVSLGKYRFEGSVAQDSAMT